MRRETGLWLPARGMVAATDERASGEPQAGVTGDAGTRVAGAFSSSASTTQKRVGPGGGSGTKSDLAIGHDEDLGRAGGGLGIPGVCHRLLHKGNRGMESVASLPDR